MWLRYTFQDLRVCVHYLGTLIIGAAVLMIPSIVCACVFGEWYPLSRYLTACALAFFIGALMRMACISPSKLTRNQAIAITALAWIVISLIAALPLYHSGHYVRLLDAIFDGVSATTTTGASLIVDLNHLSNADNMMRFMLHFAGGLGLIVVALSLGLFGKGGASTLFKSEGRSEHVLPNVVQATRFILKVACVIITITTAVLFCLMLLSGLEIPRAILHAFWLAITTFITGGLAPMSQSIMYYNSVLIEFACMIVMLLGAISFTLYYWVVKGRSFYFFDDIEIKTGIIWLFIMTVIFALSISSKATMSDLPAIMHRGVFTLIAAFTTTGLTVVTQPQLASGFSSGAFLIIALIMAVGGSSGSTAGGIKFDRIGIIAKSHAQTIKQAIAPQSAKIKTFYHHIGKRQLDDNVVKGAMTIFIFYVVTYLIGALAGIAHGYDSLMAIYESIALASNGGLTCGIVVPGMPTTLELIYILLMWAGRLEFIALLAFFAQVVASFKPREKTLRTKVKSKSKTSSTVVAISLIVVCSLSLFGCSSAKPEDKGGVSNTTVQEPNNIVDPSQASDSSILYDISIAQLNESPALYSGQTVQIEGEAIGEARTVGFDDSHAWITLQQASSNKTTNEITFFASKTIESMIDTYGAYGKSGTTMTIRGTFNAACQEHEGLCDIHAEQATVVSSGTSSSSQISPHQLIAAAIFATFGIALTLLYNRKKRD